MDATLVASATLLGLASAPHCTLMCSAPCAAAVGSGGARASLAFQVGRLGGYAAGGALAAAAVSSLGVWSQWSPALRPAWALLHAAALSLGLWLLWRGRQPAWLSPGRVGVPVPAGWHAVRWPARAVVSGGLWVAWPCGMLQSALLLAAMTSGAATGALAMSGFALASSPGLVLGPWLWLKWLTTGRTASRERWAARIAGLTLVVASGWALTLGMWPGAAAFCAAL